MTDVRLTALNPVDSQVYPVACNTSGELLVADGGPDLTVTGDLTVDGTATIDSLLTVNNTVRSNRTGSGQACFSARLSGVEKAGIYSDGSCSFSDNITMGGQLRGTGNLYSGFVSTTSFGARIGADGTAKFTGEVECNSLDVTNDGDFDGNVFAQSFIGESSTGGSGVFVGKQNGSLTSRINADGSASFTGNVTAPNITNLQAKISLILRQLEISTDEP